MTWLTATEYLCHKLPQICTVCRNNNHNSRLITRFVARVTRRVPHVDQEMPTLPEHLSLSLALSGVRVARSLIFCVILCRSLIFLLSFFLFVIMLSDLLLFMVSDNPIDIFKLFFYWILELFRQYGIFWVFFLHFVH